MASDGAAGEAFDDAVRRCAREATGAEVTSVEPLASHLSLRRFARVRLGDGRRLVARMEAGEDPAGRPAGVPPEPPLAPVLSLLEREGLPVPKRCGGDAALGLDLLEDLGDESLRDAAAAADATRLRRLYEAACDLVPRLQRIEAAPGVAAFSRRLDAALFDYKAGLFAAESLRRDGREASAGERACVRDAFRLVADVAARAPQRLAHRDLQSANLLLAPDERVRLVMIDLQGAFLAPPEYDLVCLLRDSYVELGDDELTHQLRRIRPQLPDEPDAEDFARRFDLLTLTRKGKDHARFLYAARARGDRRFLPFVPATVRALRAAARRSAEREPQLAEFAGLVEALSESPCAQ